MNTVDDGEREFTLRQILTKALIVGVLQHNKDTVQKQSHTRKESEL